LPVVRGLDFIKSNHHVTAKYAYQRGAIAGSAPIWGRYSMFEYPNWAAKFFADALMLKMTPINIPE